MRSYDFEIVALWYSEFNDTTEFIYILRWPDAITMHRQWEGFMRDEEWEEVKRRTQESYGEMVLAKVRDQILHNSDWFDNARGY